MLKEVTSDTLTEVGGADGTERRIGEMVEVLWSHMAKIPRIPHGIDNACLFMSYTITPHLNNCLVGSVHTEPEALQVKVFCVLLRSIIQIRWAILLQ